MILHNIFKVTTEPVWFVYFLYIKNLKKFQVDGCQFSWSISRNEISQSSFVRF